MLLIRIWWCCWSKEQNAEDVVADRKIKVLKMLLLIKRSKCWRRYWSKYWRYCCWSKGQSAEDVADRKVKVLNMLLLIERSKCWRCCWSKGRSVEDVTKDVAEDVAEDVVERCCWSKGESVEDVVANRKVKVLKMLMLIKELLSLKIEDKDYMMLKSFQLFIDVLPWWCWWCPLSLSYYCCCWCCCRIPFSLRGSVEILWLRRIFFMYFLWSSMVLLREPLVLSCTPMLLIGRNNKSHEVVPSNCKGGSLAPQCGYLSLHV